MKSIRGIIGEVADATGCKKVFYGDVVEMVAELNAYSRDNEEHQPAVFLLDSFKMDFSPNRSQCKTTLNILLTVFSDDLLTHDDRDSEQFSKELRPLADKFIAELKAHKATVSVEVTGEWHRPKVHKAFNYSGAEKKVLNAQLDGWELAIIYTTDFSEC